MKDAATGESIERRIDEILDVTQIGDLVRRYFDPRVDNQFAGQSFDMLGKNSRDEFHVDDLIVLNLLDEQLGAPAIGRLLAGDLNLLLADIRDDVDLWDASQEDRDRSNKLLSALRVLPGVGPTRGAKLCARKRPRLIPIYDSVVERVMDLNRGPWWKSLAQALSNGVRQDRIRALDPKLAGYTPTVLRLLDVAVWMVGSNATTARAARSAVDLSDPNPLW